MFQGHLTKVIIEANELCRQRVSAPPGTAYQTCWSCACAKLIAAGLREQRPTLTDATMRTEPVMPGLTFHGEAFIPFDVPSPPIEIA